MAVLNRSRNQKEFAGSLLGGLLLGSIVFSLLLLSAATRLNGEVGTIQNGVLGWNLFELSRQALAGGGYTASMSFFGSRLIGYFAVWFLLGLVVAVYRSKRA